MTANVTLCGEAPTSYQERRAGRAGSEQDLSRIRIPQEPRPRAHMQPARVRALRASVAVTLQTQTADMHETADFVWVSAHLLRLLFCSCLLWISCLRSCRTCSWDIYGFGHTLERVHRGGDGDQRRPTNGDQPAESSGEVLVTSSGL